MNSFDFINYDKIPTKVEMSKATKQVLEDEMKVEIPATTVLEETASVQSPAEEVIIENQEAVKEVLESVKKSKKVVAKKKMVKLN